MNQLKGLRVVVAGAGAVGSVTALMLARRGALVTLADPARGDSASAVAAGMLAPLSEALFDKTSADHFPLLKTSRDLWDAVLDGVAADPPIDRSGALIEVADPQATLARATAMGAQLGLSDRSPYLFTPEDWRLEPRPMLAALQGALEALGGRRLAGEAKALTDGQVRLQDGQTLPADALVLSTGFGGGGLTPIKGHILRYAGYGAASGPVLRGQGVYAAPSSAGLLVGATMEEGVSDLGIEAAMVARLTAAAVRLIPDLAGRPVEAFTGVRAAAPDGLPLVGPADEGPSVIVARGARRNGWLLAPLMAQVVIEHLEGRASSEGARAFAPGRLSIVR